jgi:hypothetical protein
VIMSKLTNKQKIKILEEAAVLVETERNNYSCDAIYHAANYTNWTLTHEYSVFLHGEIPMDGFWMGSNLPASNLRN